MHIKKGVSAREIETGTLGPFGIGTLVQLAVMYDVVALQADHVKNAKILVFDTLLNSFYINLTTLDLL